MLVRENEGTQLHIYYISKGFSLAELRYMDMEKFTISLMIASRKLRPYFQAHNIQVVTNLPLKQVPQNPDSSRRLMKWAVELSKIDISYKPRTLVKDQALANFIAEFIEAQQYGNGTTWFLAWSLFVDRSYGKTGSRAGVIL